MPILEVRFHLGDTETPYLMSDELIQLAMDNTTTDIAAAAMCARSLAARFSRQADKRFETIWSYNSQKAIAFERLARNLDQQAKRAGGLGVPTAGGISESEVRNADSDTDRVRPFFRDNLFANPPGPNARGSDFEE